MDELRIYEFRPLFLTLDRIGPFRNVHEIDFTDKNHHPCNFYMVVSANGMGKTTALEIFSCLMNLLGKKEISAYGHEDLDKKDGRAQLDFWVRLHWQGRDMAIVLSVLAGTIGEEVFLKPWTDELLTLHNAESWHRLGFRSPVPGRFEGLISRKDELLLDLSSTIRASFENAPEEHFLQLSFHLPTVLYFSAYRDIPGISDDNKGSNRTIGQPSHWDYQPLYAFDAHSTLWRDSLDNLAVWLKWLDNGSFEAAQKLIDEQVFVGTPKCLKGVRKVTLEAQIDAGEGEIHGLNRLSSGEKSLVHLFLRIGAHGTANTIILIDEIDAHLHIRWQYRLYNALEKLAKDHPGFTVVMTTHSTEILRRFTASLNIEKEGLYPGGDLIEQHELTG